MAADGSDDENVTKKRKSAVESQDIPCESIPGTGPETVPAIPDAVDNTKVGDFISRWILTINQILTATPTAILLVS
ncbi:hypothetical protein RND71_019615 [Anisodus tanguticus]|uniref:Uncharacterized protein n=1 Tax=Anisodus tanguticus TaxID=243964 RepID=A0AAE1S0V5_9SOLA|nr:hypothetical protein RND71_019615 [Anisodus tanguticus]